MTGQHAREPREWPPFLGLAVAALVYPVTVVTGVVHGHTASVSATVPDAGYEAAHPAPGQPSRTAS